MPLITDPIGIFLTVLAIILLVPLLFQRLKIPYIIGLILAGMAVGPHGFNILADDMSFEVFGQVGILYLMFLAGLEIDMYNLRRNLPRGLLFGILTFLIPLLAGYTAGIGLLGLDPLAAMLLASMFAAHTLLAYPIAARFGLTRQRAVVVAVAGTIVTVLGSLFVLAAVTDIYREGTLSVVELLRLVMSLAVYCGIGLYLYPRLARWFMKRYSDRVSQFIFVLAMVFAAAAAASAIGIEGVFGAFFAGLLLNRYIPARSPLMTRLEFVGNALFIPYFLIGVGMLINIGVLLDGWSTVYVAAVMSATAIASKWGAAYVTQLLCRMHAGERSMLFQLSNAHTAVALAVVSIGYNSHIFGEEILNGTIVMILVTCTVSSLGTERAAKRMKMRLLGEGEESDSLAATPGMPHTLITVSNPDTVTQLVDLAILLRGDTPPEAPLYALHVRSDNTPRSVAEGRGALETAEKSATAADTRLTPIERYDNNIVTGVLNTVAERGITEVIIGLHRRTSLIDTFLGSRIEQMLVATNKMLVVSRFFIPVSMVRRIVVYVPDKAQMETGFRRWVEAFATLARQLGCRLIMFCTADTEPYLRRVIVEGRYLIRAEYRRTTRDDDFVMLPGTLIDDDLLVVVAARRASLSFNSEMHDMPRFLQNNMSRHNLIVLYPEQFGDEPVFSTTATTMTADYVAPPSPLWLRLRRLVEALRRR